MQDISMIRMCSMSIILHLIKKLTILLKKPGWENYYSSILFYQITTRDLVLPVINLRWHLQMAKQKVLLLNLIPCHVIHPQSSMPVFSIGYFGISGPVRWKINWIPLLIMSENCTVPFAE